jgi:hypothetical protein
VVMGIAGYRPYLQSIQPIQQGAAEFMVSGDGDRRTPAIPSVLCNVISVVAEFMVRCRWGLTGGTFSVATRSHGER